MLSFLKFLKTKILGCVFLIFIASSLSGLQAQVKNITALTSVDQGNYFYPRISPDETVFFSQANYIGLFYLDGNKIQRLSEQPGAGYEPAFSGTDVFYNVFRYKGPRKYSSLIKQNFSTGQADTLLRDQRNLSSPKVLSNGQLMVTENSGLKTIVQPSGVQKESLSLPVAYVDKYKILLYENNKETELQPLGQGFYIWPAVSPDGEKLLFTKAGSGTYITDLSGNVLVNLGYANAPHWSPDGKWIVYMRDYDDGDRITSSDIFITSSDGKTTIPVTQTDDIIEMYPNWGPDSQSIVFHSQQGIIYKAELNLN